jgi:hypothetical protein
MDCVFGPARDGSAFDPQVFAIQGNVAIVIAEQRFHVAAWYVRDAVETAAFLARRQMYRGSREERCLFAAAHGAAEVATVALLAREHVSTESLCALCAPFVRHLDVPLG